MFLFYKTFPEIYDYDTRHITEQISAWDSESRKYINKELLLKCSL